MKFASAIGLMLFATIATSALAQSLPRYDPAMYCKGVSDFSGGSSVVYKGCIELEQNSYNELKPKWAALSSRFCRKLFTSVELNGSVVCS